MVNLRLCYYRVWISYTCNERLVSQYKTPFTTGFHIHPLFHQSRDWRYWEGRDDCTIFKQPILLILQNLNGRSISDKLFRKMVESENSDQNLIYPLILTVICYPFLKRVFKKNKGNLNELEELG